MSGPRKRIGPYFLHDGPFGEWVYKDNPEFPDFPELVSPDPDVVEMFEFMRGLVFGTDVLDHMDGDEWMAWDAETGSWHSYSR